jgi:hypothetical protein
MRARRALRLIPGLTAALWLGLALAQAPGAHGGRALAFPLDELVPGLEGHGLTAGPGNVIERFTVTVLALQQDLGPGIPLVLVRAGGSLIEAAGGVAAGMSGSPVFLPYRGDDALLGAIGYVFPQSDGHLALVTPIDAMRDQTAQAAVPEALAAIGAVPVATPVVIGGLGQRALALLDREVLSRAAYPLTPLQGGGGAIDDRDAGGRLAPGAAIAVQLVRGDVTIGAIGTVTEVSGEELLAFGHPLFGGGPASLTLTAAYVTAVVPSRAVPFKLANLGRALHGTVTQDRPAAIMARLDTAPEVIPVTLTVTAGGARRTLRFEVTADERLWPHLVAVATLEGIDRAWQRVAGGTAELAWEVELADGEALRLTEQVTDPADVATTAARLVGAPLALLAENAFQPTRPSALHLNVRVDGERRDAEVVEVVLEETEALAGEALSLIVRLQPWRRPSEVRSLTVMLPDDLDGELELLVRGGGEPRDDDEPVTIDDVLLSYFDLLTALREAPQHADLVVEIRDQRDRWRRLDRLSLPYVVRGAESLPLVVLPSTELGDDGDAEPPPGDDGGPTPGSEGDEPGGADDG